MFRIHNLQTVKEFLINFYFDTAKNDPGNLDEVKLGSMRYVESELQDEQYLHLLLSDPYMVTLFKNKRQEG